MRTSLFALAFGALLLTGCADDLTGPDVTPLAGDASAASAADAIGPIEDEDAVSSLFATWAGSDGVFSFRFSLEEMPAPGSPDILEAPAEVYFSGEGFYERLDQIDAVSPCRVEGQYVDGGITFTIFDDNGVVARAEGSPADDFTSLSMKVEYANGTAKSVDFKRDASRFVAAN